MVRSYDGSILADNNMNGIHLIGIWSLFYTHDVPSNYFYWYIQDNGIYRSSDTDGAGTAYTSGSPSTVGVIDYLQIVDSLQSLIFSSKRYWMMSYGNGYIAAEYEVVAWSPAELGAMPGSALSIVPRK